MKTRTFNLEVTLTEVEIDLINRLFSKDNGLIIEKCEQTLLNDDFDIMYNLDCQQIIYYSEDDDMCLLTQFGKQILQQL